MWACFLLGLGMKISEKQIMKLMEKRLFKSSILLGIALGGIRSMYWTEVSENDAVSVLYEPMGNLIKLLEKGIDELFYEQSEQLKDIE